MENLLHLRVSETVVPRTMEHYQETVANMKLEEEAMYIHGISQSRRPTSQLLPFYLVLVDKFYACVSEILPEGEEEEVKKSKKKAKKRNLAKFEESCKYMEMYSTNIVNFSRVIAMSAAKVFKESLLR